MVLTVCLLRLQVSVYVNGRLHCNQKLHYVVQNVGGAATHLASSNAVHAIIGTPPACRSLSRSYSSITVSSLLHTPCSHLLLSPAVMHKNVHMELFGVYRAFLAQVHVVPNAFGQTKRKMVGLFIRRHSKEDLWMFFISLFC